jgi:AraC-like DNA-binding protein
MSSVLALLDGIAERGWVLSHSPPPYAEELPLPAPPRRYSLLILDIEAHDRGAAEGIHDVVGSLRREFVMPVFGRPGEAIPDPGLLALRDTLAAAGAELLPSGASILHRAREVLTVRPNLASDWLRWYRLHREIGPHTEEAVRALLNDGGKPCSVDEVLAPAGLSSRSVRRYLADAALPPAGAWVRANRLLGALFTLQRDPEHDVYDAAIEAGYLSSEAFSNALFGYFGHGAPTGRSLLGLERRFHEFDQRFAQLRS